MAETDSFTKACFAFKGSKRKEKTSIDTYGFTDKGGKVRYSTYSHLWQNMDERIKATQAKLYATVFDDLLAYIKLSHKDFCPSTESKTLRTKRKEIPTTALVMGVNMPDHETTVTTLTALVRRSVTPHVATLASKDCPSMKAIMTKTLQQVVANAEALEDDDDVDVSLRKTGCSMSVLASWYTDITSRKRSPQGSPRKRKADGQLRRLFPPVVVILEDLEGFSAPVLQDFVALCSHYLDRIPLVLVFGIATAVTAIHQILPHAVSSLLSIEKFQSQSSSDYLTHVLDQVLLTNEFPFKLGSRVFYLLLDIFLYHDFSVKTFIQGLKFCMMEHFRVTAVSHLCCGAGQVAPRVAGLGHAELERLRQLPSCMKYVESQPVDRRKPLLLDDTHFKEVVTQLLVDIDSYHQHVFPLLHCLHSISKDLPRHPLGKQLREIYGQLLTGDISSTEAYKNSFSFLRVMSRESLVELLQKCASQLEGFSIFDGVVKTLRDFTAKFNDIENFTALKQKVNRSPKKGGSSNERRQSDGLIPQEKEVTVFESLRSDALQYLDDLFSEHLVCHKNLPLHEIFYFDALSAVKRHLVGTPRAAIQTALSTPHYYLQCSCCEAEKEAILGSMPDICVAYKLHLECGKLINLYDWLQAFVTIVDPASVDDDDDDSTGNDPNELMHARFIRAVSELQFLGFVKPTKRKTDHVARLTWGGC
ncbi:PREDICTED: origin recognition complex subunit 3-like [Priapulus caudatus]|uniref:Origin recognition complex subunit 3 n=1 Tax=Priapulus caudatus TaxID=37621 RepID=A0ABM1DU25_PRICU|nr:PREDICTED: origin recognition complex subunit 3-like [Priapulus caudatus]